MPKPRPSTQLSRAATLITAGRLVHGTGPVRRTRAAGAPAPPARSGLAVGQSPSGCCVVDSSVPLLGPERRAPPLGHDFRGRFCADGVPRDAAGPLEAALQPLDHPFLRDRDDGRGARLEAVIGGLQVLISKAFVAHLPPDANANTADDRGSDDARGKIRPTSAPATAARFAHFSSPASAVSSIRTFPSAPRTITTASTNSIEPSGSIVRKSSRAARPASCCRMPRRRPATGGPPSRSPPRQPAPSSGRSTPPTVDQGAVNCPRTPREVAAPDPR